MRPLVASLAAGLALVVAAPAPGALELRRIAGGFSSPDQVGAPRGVHRNTIYVLEQTGRLIRVKDGRRQVVLDLRQVVSTDRPEQGLLAHAFHPDWKTNRYLFVYYTNRRGNSRVVRYTMNRAGTRARPATRKLLLKQGQPNPSHNGGTLAFGSDGRLYLSLGDGGSACDPHNRAQDLSTRLGKVLRRSAGRWRIVAYGLRNPWRFSFDRATGDMYIGDVGQSTREEVDYLPAAEVAARPRENYGWNAREGTVSGTCPDSTGLKGNGVVVDPIHDYPRSVGFTVIGGFVYRGTNLPARHRGRYFFGDLSGKVFSMDAVTGSTLRTHAFTVPSLVSFGEDSRGRLYLVSLNGVVYRLVDR